VETVWKRLSIDAECFDSVLVSFELYGVEAGDEVGAAPTMAESK
jgi:hypothetical protein